MSDVEIIFPNSKAPLAERLREAIGRAGYDVAPGGGVAPDEAPAAGDARAVLLLWDRTSIQQPGLQQAARAARNHGRAIDVSADGITPLDLADESRLIQLSAWRGEPHHPGWRKILAELERLCGAPGHGRHAAAHAPAPAPAARGATARADAGPSRGGAKLAVMGVAILVALLLVGFAAMSRRSLNVDGAPAPARPALAAAQPMATPTSGTPPAAPPQAPQPAAALQVTPGAAADAAVTPAATASPPAQTAPASTAGAGDRARRAPASRPRLAGVVRYTKYAKTMRLFCQRSGRHTPQCRLFNANLANAGR